MLEPFTEWTDFCMNQKSVLWAEDLEGHRQPSLYYLGEEEGADGTHLVCNWNGAPTDFDDYGLDTLITHREHEHLEAKSSLDEVEPAADDNFFDYPNPAAELIDIARGPCNEPQSRRQNDLDLKECAHLDFLTVPPTSHGLLRRLVKNLLNMGEKLKKPSVFQQENTLPEHPPLDTDLNEQTYQTPNQSKLSTMPPATEFPKPKIPRHETVGR